MKRQSVTGGARRERPPHAGRRRPHRAPPDEASRFLAFTNNTNHVYRETEKATETVSLARVLWLAYTKVMLVLPH